MEDGWWRTYKELKHALAENGKQKLEAGFEAFFEAMIGCLPFPVLRSLLYQNI